ncbi:S-layer homology domain-containing protein [Paenibacillus sp. P36]|uniref:S-layer homology domain-containing protein n=1 Tax=Paenibacillus sp. P36 TaxID=3342538 RepID=UPI0038B33673
MRSFKSFRRRVALSLAVFLICNLGLGQVSLLSMANVASAAGVSSVDVLDPDFINSHGGNSVSIQANPSRSPYDVFGEAFGTDNPVEGATKTAREILGEEAERHVANYYDQTLGKDVFKVEVNGNDCFSCYLHNTTYDSSTGQFVGGNDDRQRIEIRPPDENHDRIGLENDITAYNWKLKIDKDLTKPDGFFHIFQYKAYNSYGLVGNKLPLHDAANYPSFSSAEDGNPILTFTVSSSATQNLEFRYADIGTDAGQETLASIPLNAVKDRWVDITVKILNSEYGWVTMSMKDVETGEILMTYNDPNRVLDMWRRPEIKYNGMTFEGPYPAVDDMINRPKWGIYRKADKSNPNVKDAKIYLADMTLYKSAVDVSPVNLAYGKKAYNYGPASGNAFQIANAKPERLLDGVQTDPVKYTNLTQVPQNNTSALGDLSWIGTESSKKGSVVIDLGKKMPFSQVKLFAKSLRLQTVNIAVSDDETDHSEADLNNVIFKPDTSFTYNGPNSGGDDAADKQYIIDLGKTFTSRYVKFYFVNGTGSNGTGTPLNGDPTFIMTGPPRITELELYNAPQTPSNVSIEYTGGSQAAISWNEVPANHFIIYDNSKVLVDQADSNKVNLTNLDPGAVYNLSVRTVYTDPYSFKPMLSAMSEVKVLHTDGDPIIPNPPSSVTAIALSDKSIRVDWAAVTDAQNYRVALVSGDTERIVAAEVQDTTYTIKDLSPGRTYKVKIYAIRRGTLSAAGAEGEVTTTGIKNANDNLLFNKEVQYPRVWNDDTSSYGAGKALDNDTGSRWVALKGSTSSWMMVDIGEPTPVNTLEYDSYQNKLKKVSFYYATDGEAFTNPDSDKWIKLWTDDRVSQGKYGNPNITSIAERITLPAPVEARFIKFTVDEVDGDINVNEVKAFGPMSFTGNSSLKATEIADRRVALSWSGATTTLPVSMFDIYQGNTKLTSVTADVYNYSAVNLMPNSAYTFRVKAVSQSVYGSVYETLGGLPLQLTTLGPITVPPSGSDSHSDSGHGPLTSKPSNPGNPDAIVSNPGVITAVRMQGETTYSAAIPAASLSNGSPTSITEVRSEIGNAYLPGNMFSSSELGEIKKVELRIALTEKSTLPGTLQQLIGDRPIVDLALWADGKKVAFNNPSASVEVTVPYKPTAEELTKPEHIVVWYVDDKGVLTPVPSGKYDAGSGTVTFRTTHFSKYAVGFVVKSFADLTNFEWARQSIEVLASKGVINGKSDVAFSPGTPITRAEFITLLMRTLGLSAKSEAVFDDVKAADYFYQEVLMAKALGIAEGKDRNLFAPNEELTRQEMMTMTARALKQAGKLNTGVSSTSMSTFADYKDVASYAVESAALLINNGLIQGNGHLLQPLNKTTRAEVAVLMYRIYNN